MGNDDHSCKVVVPILKFDIFILLLQAIKITSCKHTLVISWHSKASGCIFLSDSPLKPVAFRCSFPLALCTINTASARCVGHIVNSPRFQVFHLNKVWRIKISSEARASEEQKGTKRERLGFKARRWKKCRQGLRKKKRQV